MITLYYSICSQYNMYGLNHDTAICVYSPSHSHGKKNPNWSSESSGAKPQPWFYQGAWLITYQIAMSSNIIASNIIAMAPQLLSISYYRVVPTLGLGFHVALRQWPKDHLMGYKQLVTICPGLSQHRSRSTSCGAEDPSLGALRPVVSLGSMQPNMPFPGGETLHIRTCPKAMTLCMICVFGSL